MSSNLQIIAELCGICEALVRVVRSDAAALEQAGLIVMEEEREKACNRYKLLLGDDELPDEYDAEET